MDPQPPDPQDRRRAEARRARQLAEILGLVAAGQLHRAADLAHEHLAEFPADRGVGDTVAAALGASAVVDVRRRAGEFPRR